MGNCLKGTTADDISLLRGAETARDSTSSDQLGPPPPYQVRCKFTAKSSRLGVLCSDKLFLFFVLA